MITGTTCGKNTTKEDFEYPPGPYCVVTGSLLGGFKIHGPFDDMDQAVEWAESKTVLLGHCTIMPMEKG